MFERLWVRILALYYKSPYQFFTLIFVKSIVGLKRVKINEKEAVVGPFKIEFIP